MPNCSCILCCVSAQHRNWCLKWVKCTAQFVVGQICLHIVGMMGWRYKVVQLMPPLDLPTRLLSPSTSLSTLAHIHLRTVCLIEAAGKYKIHSSRGWRVAVMLEAAYTPKPSVLQAGRQWLRWRTVCRTTLHAHRSVGGGRGTKWGDGERGEADMWESRRESLEQLASGASEPLHTETLGTVTASYYRISSSRPRQPVVISVAQLWTISVAQSSSNNHVNRIVPLLN